MVDTTQIRIRTEDVQRLEALKLIEQEPYYSVIARVLDKAKQFDKKVKG